MKIKVSCIIPTYNNSGDQIRGAIDSVLNSMYPVSEVVLVDDGSTDSTAFSVVKELREKGYNNIVFIKQDNKGPSAARNKGVEICSNDWLIFLDADDRLLPDGLSAKIDKIPNHESEILAGLFGTFIWSNSGEAQFFSSVDRQLKPRDVGVMGKAPGGLPSYLLKREVYRSVGGLDETLYFNEDIDFILRVIARGFVFYGVNEPGFIRNLNPRSHSRKDKRRALSGGRKFLGKAWRLNLLSKWEVFRRLALNCISLIKFLFVNFWRHL